MSRTLESLVKDIDDIQVNQLKPLQAPCNGRRQEPLGLPSVFSFNELDPKRIIRRREHEDSMSLSFEPGSGSCSNLEWGDANRKTKKGELIGMDLTLSGCAVANRVKQVRDKIEYKEIVSLDEAQGEIRAVMADAPPSCPYLSLLEEES
ncbi:hypothetical protein HN748_05140 [Candidatus Peregrinibacteria bacterium]|jgi:hypothetical protein|nr:hypothetical protein [Candidatus Peregrinibacteria bacterium]MBT7483237.1 hypothetical protein [Candidatus Peregrinibacteria bacterium]MBT7703595.1 hypothetical protein [Candidatus Peregrinibacteria bacterium]